MKINSVVVGFLETNCYVVEGFFNNSDYVMVIDPGENIDLIQSIIPGPVTHIVLTHAHFDHIGALQALQSAYPKAKLYISEKEDFSVQHQQDVVFKVFGAHASGTHFVKNGIKEIKPDILLKDGDHLLDFEILHTPGHTSGSICLYCENEKIMFSGDTLFASSYGRCDIDGNEKEMKDSLKKLMALDENITIYPGHEIKSTIGSAKNYIF